MRWISAHKTLHWQVFWLYGSLNRCSFTRTSPYHLLNGWVFVCVWKWVQNKNFNIIFVNILCAVLEGSHVKNEQKNIKQTVQVRQKKNNVCESFLHTSFTTLNHVCIWKSCSLLLPAQMNNRPPFNPVCTHLCCTKRAQHREKKHETKTTTKKKQKQKAKKSQQPVFIPEVIKVMLEPNILNQLMRTLRSVFVSCDAKGVNLN